MDVKILFYFSLEDNDSETGRKKRRKKRRMYTEEQKEGNAKRQHNYYSKKKAEPGLEIITTFCKSKLNKQDIYKETTICRLSTSK